MNEQQTKPDLESMRVAARRMLQHFLDAPSRENWRRIQQHCEWYADAWIEQRAEEET